MADATGTSAAATIGASDTVYIKGEYTANGTGTNYFEINARYTNGAKILVWPGFSAFTVDANNAHSHAISINKQVTLADAIATGSKVDVSTSAGVRFTPGAVGTIVRRVVAKDNRRHGFYGNNVGGDANILLEDCIAYQNTTLPSDNTGSGRFASGFHMDATGAVRFIRCRAWRNGNSSNVGGDADGRGFSIVGSDNCSIEFCEAWENGDYTGAISSNRNGSGVEGFNSDNVRVIGCHLWAQGAAGEIKYSCDNWVLTGNVMRGLSYVFQWGEFDGVGSTNLKFHNNTVALEQALQFGVAVGLSSGSADLRNNVFITARDDFPAVSIRNASVDIDLATITFDYNLHYGCGTNHVYYQNTSLNQAYALAAYQALTGASAHSVNSLDNTDPLLDASYHPREGSPLIGAATYIAGARHMNGKRMSVINPTIGAYNYEAPRSVALTRAVAGP
jgi:hypothetical protein